MRILRRAAMTALFTAALASVSIPTAGAAPFGSLGAGADLAITHATGEGTNACSVRVTNEGESDATAVMVHATLYGSVYFGTLAPGESKTTTQFDCGFVDKIFYFVTGVGDTNLSNNFLLVTL